MYINPLYKKMLKEDSEVPDWFVDTTDLKPSHHLETQVAVQKYVDSAVSKTINMPAGTTPEQLSKLTLEYIRDLKGVTVYVDGSREGQILNKVSVKEVKEYLANGPGLDFSVTEEPAQCATGKCEI